MNDETPQHHNFYDAEDEDWVKFHGTSGNIYTIEVRNLEKNCDVVLELYDSNQELLSSKNTPLIPHVDEQLHWQCPEDGIYYLRVRNDLNVFGECTAYFLKIYSPIGPSGVNFKIKVMDILSRVPVENAQVEIIGYGHGIDLGNGEYLLNCEGDNPIKIIEINASGYMTESDEISVAMDDEMKLVKELKLKPFHSADYNPSDNKISLSELLRVIQLYNKGAYHCDPQGEDRYGAGSGDQTCPPHHSDYNPKDWRINLSELLRLVQFYNASGYHVDLSGEDSFCAGMR